MPKDKRGIFSKRAEHRAEIERKRQVKRSRAKNISRSFTAQRLTTRIFSEAKIPSVPLWRRMIFFYQNKVVPVWRKIRCFIGLHNWTLDPGKPGTPKMKCWPCGKQSKRLW